MVKITINGVTEEVEQGTAYRVLAHKQQQSDDQAIMLAVVNGKVKELAKPITKDAEVVFQTIRDLEGFRAYVRTAILLFAKAVHDVVGEGFATKVKIDYLIGTGHYCRCEGNFTLDESFLARIEARMKEMVESGNSITKHHYPAEDGMAILKEQGMVDREKLLHYRRSVSVNLYEIDGYYDYFYGYMLPDMSYIKYFALSLYQDGILLSLPTKADPTHVQITPKRDKLFEALKQSDEWGECLDIYNVGDLNEQIAQGNLQELILMQEALLESRIGEIAREIKKRDSVKFVLIAGPSSSGKTTFSHRLSIQLKTLGMKPHPIAIDDYFVNRDQTPRDAVGNYNFECIEAIDCKQFNEDMLGLLAGERVQLPSYNFKTGKREYKGDYKELGADDVLVIEGIHGLNQKMTDQLADESKYRIYISALTTLNIDEHNRIPTTDGRLLRRIVRDARTRAMGAKQTISMWSSVRRGEEMNIFPYQENVDVMFNSALIYEIAVLKQYAEPLLLQIKLGEPEYLEAQRLLKFLEFFLNASREMIPYNSITREFVGGSCFHV
ncbi:MAG: nucleoside kinase [Eubacteriales bacterium]